MRRNWARRPQPPHPLSQPPHGTGRTATRTVRRHLHRGIGLYHLACERTGRLTTSGRRRRVCCARRRAS
jgi:hypothetical protein